MFHFILGNREFFSFENFNKERKDLGGGGWDEFEI